MPRPEILYPFFGDVGSLPGIGPRIKQHFSRFIGDRLLDLLFHFPTGLIDRTKRPKIAEALAGEIVTLNIVVGKHYPSRNRRAPYKVKVYDDSGQMTLVFFNGRESYLKSQLPEGEERLISGKLDKFGNDVQMTHPDYMVSPDQADDLPLLEPVYPLTAGISAKVMIKALKGAKESINPLPNWLDTGLQDKRQWPQWDEALLSVHNPQNLSDVGPLTHARQRLAYDELLANQVALSMIRRAARHKKGAVHKGNGHLSEKYSAGLPYKLTSAQLRTLSEISGDMASDNAMLRLVQGDVGSGKTVVAVMAMLQAVESGAQAAMLAPTEILASQHYDGMVKELEAIGLKVALLTGRIKGKKREQILADLAAGDLDILIGTHAVIQKDVAFQNLGLAVIDEQHRFGVHQRMALADKGRVNPDVLVMTATPIPRTLSLSYYGDMDVSRIDEKPPGRKPIDTRVISNTRLHDVMMGLERTLKKGQRVYWVCPLVEESEALDLAAAEERYVSLQKIYGDQVGLVHGKMKGAEKDAVMERFQQGELTILVATTVIEVGVNVPEATVMVVEHAERFGLAQLHQLRGRVGRGSDASSCVLIRADKLSDTARTRLKTIRETEDGFVIAEEDLKLRGAGEVLGVRQSGLPSFKTADLSVHGELLVVARDDANLIMTQDPDLMSERGKALRVLLYLFERDQAVQLMKSG